MVGVENLQRIFILKYRCSFLKSDSMFLLIGCRLIFILFKIHSRLLRQYQYNVNTKYFNRRSKKMLKLNASYSKKVPAGEEYSSQSYHASVEVELPDGLSPDQLQTRIHETFDLVRNSVEAELHGKTPANHGGHPAAGAPRNGSQRNRSGARQNDAPASPKQLSYLLDLARQRGITPQQIAARFQVPDIQHLTRQQCSDQIDEWRAA